MLVLLSLTRMQCHIHSMQEGLSSFLPEDAIRGLPSLVHLKLEIGLLKIQPKEACQLDIQWAVAAPHLTHLHLSRSRFFCFSPVMGLTELQLLDVYNCLRQLEDSFPAVVKLLSQLCTLKMKKPNLYACCEPHSLDDLAHNWDAVSMSLIDSTREDLPELDLQT